MAKLPLPDRSVHVPASFTEAETLVLLLQTCWSEPALTLKELFRMFTWLVDVHEFWTTVHLNTLFPPPRPVTPEVARLGLLTVPPPPRTLQLPVPCDGWAASSEAMPLQTVWSAPALDTTWSLRIEVVLETVQEPWETVHLKLFAPSDSPVTELAALLGTETVPLPLSTLHVPEPCSGVVPFRLPVLEQDAAAGPASETTLLFITTRLAVWVQALFDTVQVNTLPPRGSDVTAVLATPGCWIDDPLSVLHLPVPMLGTVALS